MEVYAFLKRNSNKIIYWVGLTVGISSFILGLSTICLTEHTEIGRILTSVGIVAALRCLFKCVNILFFALEPCQIPMAKNVLVSAGLTILHSDKIESENSINFKKGRIL